MPQSDRFLSALLVAIVVVVAFAAGVWFSAHHASTHDGAGVEGLLWPDPPQVPSFYLVDHQGNPFTLEQLRGKWSLLFFGFTHCPDVCPTSLDAMARAHQQLQQDPLYAGRGQVVFISVDPERDTAAILADYVHYFSPDFIAATANVEELKALTAALGVLFMKLPQGGDSYTMDHSAGIFFISPDTRLVSVLTPPHNAAEISHRFKAVSAFIEAQK